MSYAGSVLAAIKSIQSNRALKKKQSLFKNPLLQSGYDTARGIIFTKPTEEQLKENKIRRQLFVKRQKTKSIAGFIIGSIVAFILAVLLLNIIF